MIPYWSRRAVERGVDDLAEPHQPDEADEQLEPTADPGGVDSPPGPLGRGLEAHVPTMPDRAKSQPVGDVRGDSAHSDLTEILRVARVEVEGGTMPIAVYVLGLAIFAQGTSELMLAGLLPELATDLQRLHPGRPGC